MSRSLGQEVENNVAAYLSHNNTRIIATNFHCRAGEIDLIGIDRSTIIFFEVRYRKTQLYGSAEESVTVAKQQKILTTAQHFLISHPKYNNLSCRFDVIACSPTSTGLNINWIKGAFTA